MVSVIIPIYNTEDYLEQCILSVINQSYKDLEIILLNDGSTDGSGSICEKYASLDDRIVYIDKKNEGQGTTRNLGIELAKGEYTMFVDSDDYISEIYVECAVDRLKEFDADICIFGYTCLTEYEVSFVPPTILLKESGNVQKNKLLLGGMSPLLCNKMYKTHLIKEKKVKMTNTMCEDLVFLPEVLLNAKKIVTIDKSLYAYRCNRPGNLSTNYSRYDEVLNNINELKKYFDDENIFSTYWRELFFISFDIFKDILFRFNGNRKDLAVPENIMRKYYSYKNDYILNISNAYKGLLNTSYMENKYLLLGGFGLRTVIRNLLFDHSNMIDHFGSSSLISMMQNQSVEPDEFVENCTNWFRRKQITRDFDKTFLKSYSLENIDIIAMDLIEEVNEILKIGKTYVTKSVFLKNSPMINDYNAIPFIDSRRRKLFVDAVKKFATIIENKKIKVYMIENYLCTEMRYRVDEIFYFSNEKNIMVANEELKWYYKTFKEIIPETCMISTRDLDYLHYSDCDFYGFGCSPDYANPFYYKYLALKIMQQN